MIGNLRIENRLTIIIAIAVSSIIFITDIFTPLGIADGVSYIAVVVLTLWMNKKKSTLIAAIATTVLTLGGILFSSAGESPVIFITNRTLSLMGIWCAAFLILKFKKSEQIGNRNKESLNALFSNATVGIIMMDSIGKITMVNHQAELQFNLSGSQLIGQNISRLFAEQISDQAFHQTGNNNNLQLEKELTAIKSDKDSFPAEIKISSFKLNAEICYFAFITDISERKKQHEALLKSNAEIKKYADKLKESNAELESFAYISSHDLQEPLRKIQAFGDKLKQREQENLAPESIDYINRMLNAAGRMQRLIDDLFSYSRISTQAKEFETISLNSIIRDVLSDLEITIEKANAEIQVHGSFPEITGDPTQLRQLFQNLIANAVKFRKDGVNPLIKISCRVNSNFNFIRIIIEDNGIGFNEKYADKIFGIFQRLENRKYDGSGIGLAVCKKIVQRHNGEISVKSKENIGTVFSVTLPLTLNKVSGENHLSAAG